LKTKDECPLGLALALRLFFVNMQRTESFGVKELSIGVAPARELVETGETNQAFPELREV